MGSIYEYSYKPWPIFHSTLNDGALLPNKNYMGVELEIDGRYDNYVWASEKQECANELTECDPNEHLFYLKHDGSLHYGGFEIVTHPCTLGYHTFSFPWDKICDIAMKHGYRSHESKTCGLHVHVNREAFGSTVEEQDLNVAKAMILCNGFWTEFVKFSRREPNQLRWAAKGNQKLYCDDKDLIQKSKLDSCHGHMGRYHAINLQNRNTIEFRIFRGTLKRDTIFATLQFLMNLVAYVKSKSLEDIQKADWYDIVHYTEYEELNHYLIEQELDIHKKIKGTIAPLVYYLRVLHNMPSTIDGVENPFAYVIESAKASEVESKTEGGRLFHTNDCVAILAPRSKKKIMKYAEVSYITNSGNVKLTGESRVVRASRILPILMDSHSGAWQNNIMPDYIFANIDNAYWFGTKTYDAQGIKCLYLLTNPNLGTRIEVANEDFFERVKARSASGARVNVYGEQYVISSIYRYSSGRCQATAYLNTPDNVNRQDWLRIQTHFDPYKIGIQYSVIEE